jgi:hypothetical protein
MPRRGSKQPYKPKVEYKYTIKDVAELAGMTRNALGVAKVHGKIEPGDIKSVINFLSRRIIDNRLTWDLFTAAARTPKRMKGSKSGSHVSGNSAPNLYGLSVPGNLESPKYLFSIYCLFV